jgi:molybdopterin-guanine dinucleotide biosynthesis protein A
VSAIAGIFVGGAGKRMGGCGGTIVERWLAVLRSVGVDRVVLVGRSQAYAPMGLETIDDAPSGVGPLGGLCALLQRAGDARALALACDMPFVTGPLIERLLAAPNAPIVAPRRGDLWEPLFAKYDPMLVLPLAVARVAATRYSLQGLLEEAGAVELPIHPGEADQLRDWDTIEDLRPRVANRACQKS